MDYKFLIMEFLVPLFKGVIKRKKLSFDRGISGLFLLFCPACQKIVICVRKLMAEYISQYLHNTPRIHPPPNSQKPGPFCSSAATLARLFHVEIF